MEIKMEPIKFRIIIKEGALFARINRRLSKLDQICRKARGAKERQSFGDFYILDIPHNCVISYDCDLAELAKELGLLQSHEGVA